MRGFLREGNMGVDGGAEALIFCRQGLLLVERCREAVRSSKSGEEKIIVNYQCSSSTLGYHIKQLCEDLLDRCTYNGYSQ